jgi:hypothetical protein
MLIYSPSPVALNLPSSHRKKLFVDPNQSAILDTMRFYVAEIPMFAKLDTQNASHKIQKPLISRETSDCCNDHVVHRILTVLIVKLTRSSCFINRSECRVPQEKIYSCDESLPIQLRRSQ